MCVGTYNKGERPEGVESECVTGHTYKEEVATRSCV